MDDSERNVRSSSPPYMSVPKKLKEKKVSNWHLQQHSAKSIDKDLDGSNLNYDRTACTYVGFRHLYELNKTFVLTSENAANYTYKSMM